MNINEIKELARKFTPEQLENCITMAIEQKEGHIQVCDGQVSGEVLEVINTLAKAQTVRELMEQGMSEIEAIRELARRIRLAQGGKL
ncbi:hypothetical protein JCM14244_08650 [Venenivibrio stagnispumantis]|uniref:Uncharacterized protein n=1 Tax=Venenivibrio stagnispumantis TaxID=407998 RepID=A0AA45WLN5_9AQUI|nr:hypothetical protein [Venenivibrio stagnispumantis]MCW4573435.1 hypothetical protein [Venenivibrio stagnispumantis]SMP11966.1 hypothetical protein SAMN06264868_10923 [Venenivibrio stagnispumantis]